MKLIACYASCVREKANITLQNPVKRRLNFQPKKKETPVPMLIRQRISLMFVLVQSGRGYKMLSSLYDRRRVQNQSVSYNPFRWLSLCNNRNIQTSVGTLHNQLLMPPRLKEICHTLD